MKPPSRGLMAGMEDQDAVEMGMTPDSTDRRQSDSQTREPMEGSDDEEANVSPEEQEAYDLFVETAMSIVYANGEVQPGILKMLDDDPADLIAALGDEVPEFGERFNPVVALAATSVIVVMQVIEQLGEKPDGSIIFHGGKAVLEDLASLAEQAGGDEFTQEEINEAFLHAVDLYQAVGTATGAVDKEAASAEFAEMLNAQEQGRLDDILPGLPKGQ